MIKRKALAFVAVFGVAIPLALSGAAGARVGSQTTGISSSEIKVGALVEGQFALSDVGTAARFAEENDKGGVNGRKFTLVAPTYYKQGDTAAALAEAQRLVQQEGVAAIVPSLTSVPPMQFLTQQKTPLFGWNISPLSWDTPYGFGITGSLVAPFPKSAPGSLSLPSMLTKQLKDEGNATAPKGQTIAIIGSDDASSKSGTAQAAKTFKYAGYEVTYAKGALSLTTPTTDYTPFVQAIMTSNGGQPPNIVYPVVSFADVQGISKGLRQAGYTGIIVNPTTYDPRIVKAAESLEVYTQWSIPEATDNVNIQKVVDAILKHDPNATLSLGTLAGYFSADMFIQAVKAAGKSPTGPGIQKAAAKMTYQIKNVIGPTTYPAAYTLGTSCAQLAKSDGTAFSVLVPYGCYPALNFPSSGNGKPKVIPAPKG